METSVTEPLPEILKTIIITYEDEYYYYHLGVNPISVIKAAVTDVRHRSIKRGASTITMQVMRMKNKHAQKKYHQQGIGNAGGDKIQPIPLEKYIGRKGQTSHPLEGIPLAFKLLHCVILEEIFPIIYSRICFARHSA